MSRTRAAVALAGCLVVAGSLTATTGTGATGVDGQRQQQGEGGPVQQVKGGTDTTHAEHPYTVVITRPGSSHPQKVSCGGSLVRPNKVVTAAHCMDPTYGAIADKEVIWGRTDLRTTEGQVAKISSYWKHPDYEWGGLDGDDVAVLTLDRNIGTRESLITIATDTATNAPGTDTTLSTYGFTGPSGSNSFTSIIQKATLPVIEDSKCTELGWQFTATKQLCIGPTKNDELGVCPGDSGAPLVVSTAAGRRQVGLIESGDSNCAGPQIASELTTYAALIEEQLGGDPDPDPDPPGGVVNGGFEAGDLSGWTVAGTARTATLLSTGAQAGTRAARLGSTQQTNGESTLSQTFTAPAGSSRLSVYYSMTCPDTVRYAWAKVVLLDRTSGQTTTPLGKTCTSGAGWKEVTATVTPGHSYTLTLVNRDDNHPDDPVYTSYDSISVR
ncbi:trypsin-like serine protease [Nocardioides speluncae]|uniref:trypsin-like serine protease n=1 Tax=Nocardioides speluncae TaxID=2670337 RepID=UPI001379A791|nr:trypsin-like serine protease [Nocardioides speluncae]